jgi:hypothetical protein
MGFIILRSQAGVRRRYLDAGTTKSRGDCRIELD